ncbi:MAG: LiaF domain-containing protein [Bacteroidota bacterium]
MENQVTNTEHEDMWKRSEKEHKRGKIVSGILVVIAGSLFLAKELGADIPQWVFTWKMALIAFGLIIGAKNNFRQAGWIIFVIIGGVFLIGDINPNISIKPFLWPVLIILIGIAMIFKPRRKHSHRHWGKFHDRKYGKAYEEKYNRFYARKYGQPGAHDYNECYAKESSSSDDVIDFTTFMGSVKKNILSKNFKGGDVSNVFGGTELNLSQADIETNATLDLHNVFGGTRLIVPANWEIHSELVSVMGSIEDKRPVQPMNTENPKILILKGTTFMGGIDIRSY